MRHTIIALFVFLSILTLASLANADECMQTEATYVSFTHTNLEVGREGVLKDFRHWQALINLNYPHDLREVSHIRVMELPKYEVVQLILVSITGCVMDYLSIPVSLFNEIAAKKGRDA